MAREVSQEGLEAVPNMAPLYLLPPFKYLAISSPYFQRKSLGSFSGDRKLRVRPMRKRYLAGVFVLLPRLSMVLQGYSVQHAEGIGLANIQEDFS